MKSLALVAIFTCISVTRCKIPSYIHVCHRSDPNLDQCIIDSTHSLRGKLKEGMPEIDCPSFEPLIVNTTLSFTFGGPGSLPTNITKLIIHGITDFEIESLKSKISKNYFKIKAHIPKLYLEGEYEMDAKIILLELKGRGPLTINITDYKFECVLRGTKEKFKDEEPFVFGPTVCEADIGKAVMNMENLFNGNKLLGKAANDAINDNYVEFFEAIKPAYLQTVCDITTDLGNKIASKLTYKETFPY